VPHLVVATRCAIYCLQTHSIGDLRAIECKYEEWIGRQPWVLVFLLGDMHSFFNSRGENIFVVMSSLSHTLQYNYNITIKK
jgi:hypothetical protein